MFFVPYESFELHTSCDPDEAISRIDRFSLRINRVNRTGVPVVLFWAQRRDRSRINVDRLIRHRRVSLPIIFGEVYPEKSGSHIRISLRLHWVYIIFIMVCFIMTGIVFSFWIANELIPALQTRAITDDFLITLYVAGIPFLFGYLVSLINFKIEARISRGFLFRLFQ